ncbi:hypothetical protein, partial [Enterobacter ludwigii]|uniref:hypothetical protein n=1 Tax=Enterobacter ludwigii TaxID=299767 RepID=UPI001A97DC32
IEMILGYVVFKLVETLLTLFLKIARFKITKPKFLVSHWIIIRPQKAILLNAIQGWCTHGRIYYYGVSNIIVNI